MNMGRWFDGVCGCCRGNEFNIANAMPIEFYLISMNHKAVLTQDLTDHHVSVKLLKHATAKRNFNLVSNLGLKAQIENAFIIIIKSYYSNLTLFILPTCNILFVKQSEISY